MNQTHSSIWAKSSEKGSNTLSLAEHIKDVLTVFDKLNHRINDTLYHLIRLTIICHDWGKVLPSFQIRTLKNRAYNPASPLIDIPHSFFSLLCIDEQKMRRKLREITTDDAYFEFFISAIAYHHWRENFFEIISFSTQEIADLLNELIRTDKIRILKENLKEEIKQLGGKWYEFIEFNIEMANGLCKGVPFFEYARPPYQLYFLPKRVRIDDQKMRDWILMAGFLQRSDHFASFCEEEGEDIAIIQPELSPLDFSNTKERIKKKIQKNVLKSNEESIWQFTRIDDYKDKNLILIAPTGYGKTEFAFLWGSGEKCFYTLPLRAAVNQIFKRAQEIFGEDKTGLLHSDADVFLMGDGGEGQKSLKAYDLARQLAFPAIISTGDQFFPYALRPPGYEKIYATFSYSRLFIDEVQAYDPRAAAIVVKFIEDIVRMGGKFLLMTATLPEFVRKEIKDTIGEENFEEINLYKEEKKKFENIKKHKIRLELIEMSSNKKDIEFSIPDEKLIEVLNIAKQGKRVLLITNTVKQAQYIFHKLKEKANSSENYAFLNDKIWLLHSRFTLQDRENHEKTLEKEFSNPKHEVESEGKILVATQVVEASLDIDADVLFTEIAPLDSLVQRMGRVLRRYGPMASPSDIPEPSEPNVFIWIFKNELNSGRGYVYETDLLLITLKLLSLLKKDKDDYIESENIKNWFDQKMKDAKKNRDKLISFILSEIFGSAYSGEEIFTTRQNENQPKRIRSKAPTNAIVSSSLQKFEFVCSEYDKYEMVKRLYESLPDGGNYMTKFYKTKDLLDAGYMSDRRDEAHKLFREIFTLSVIPSKMREDFIKAVQAFFNIHKNEKKLYTLFKMDVLAKFVVQIPVRFSKIKEWNLDHLEWWIRGQEIEGISEKERKRLLNWCQGIYFIDIAYGSGKGVDTTNLFEPIDTLIL